MPTIVLYYENTFTNEYVNSDKNLTLQKKMPKQTKFDNKKILLGKSANRREFDISKYRFISSKPIDSRIFDSPESYLEIAEPPIVVPDNKGSKFKGSNPNVHWKELKKTWMSDISYGLSTKKIINPVFDADKYHTYEQGTEEWKSIRKQFISASGLSGLFGFWTTLGMGYTGYKRLEYAKGLESFYNSVCFNLKVHALESNKTLSDLPKHIAYSEHEEMKKDVKLVWGSNHEANGLCVIANKIRNVISVTGFHTAIVDTDSFKKLPIGASPDGLIENVIPESVVDQLDLTNYVIEIKCPCPFMEKDGLYTYRKVKPYGEVPPYYIPQIQMQMYLTKRKDALFCCYTPTLGCNFFHVKFDENYCREMVELIGYFAKYCWENSTPPKDNFWSSIDRRYKEFCSRTVAISKSSRLILFVNDSDVYQMISKYMKRGLPFN
jgi:hypothetical protein